MQTNKKLELLLAKVKATLLLISALMCKKIPFRATFVTVLCFFEVLLMLKMAPRRSAEVRSTVPEGKKDGMHGSSRENACAEISFIWSGVTGRVSSYCNTPLSKGFSY